MPYGTCCACLHILTTYCHPQERAQGNQATQIHVPCQTLQRAPCTGRGRRGMLLIDQDHALSFFGKRQVNLHAKYTSYMGGGKPYLCLPGTYVPVCFFGEERSFPRLLYIANIADASSSHACPNVCILCRGRADVILPNERTTWVCTKSLGFRVDRRACQAPLPFPLLSVHVPSCISITSKATAHLLALQFLIITPLPLLHHHTDSRLKRSCVPSFPCWSLPSSGPSAWKAMRVGSARRRVMRTMPTVRPCVQWVGWLGWVCWVCFVVLCQECRA